MIEYLVLQRAYNMDADDHFWLGAGEPVADRQLPEALNRLGRGSWLLITPLGQDRLIFRRRYREEH